MLKSKKTVEIIGVPSDLGANVQGASMGPAAIRIAGLKNRIEALSYQVIDNGDLAVPARDSFLESFEKDKFISPIMELCVELKSRVKSSLDQGRMPLVLGGDHSIAIGTISGVAAHLKATDKKMGVIWIDAHGDFNTPSSSPSGNIHGMPLAVVVGHGHDLLVNLGGIRERVAPKNVALIGIRMIDSLERELLRTSGISYFTMRDIDERGMPWVMAQAIATASDGTDGIHLSFDIDAIDPLYAPGVSTRAVGGLTIRESRLALEFAHECGKILSMEFVEVNPSMDVCFQTAKLCVDLIQSALGKSML